jgi:hypothetical protein
MIAVNRFLSIVIVYDRFVEQRVPTEAVPAPGFVGPLASAFSLASAADLEAMLAFPDDALPVHPASDRTVWDPDAGRIDRVVSAALLARAEEDLAEPWPIPLASAAARVHRDGDRVGWEQPAFARQDRLSRAAVAAALTLEDRWIDEVADGVVLLCEQSSWCWPAHDDTLARHGAVLATVTDPYLDLGAGDVGGHFAWIDQLLGAQLDERYPGLRARMRHETRVRVLDPFVRRRDWHWIGLDGDVHNWNPWIHGNVLLAALRLLDAPDESELRARIVGLVIEGLDRYVASLPGDGAIDEGYSYWWNGACRALEALDTLRHATGGGLDAMASVPALRETIAFPHRMHLGGDWFVNVADGRARPSADQPWHALHRAARQADDRDAQRFAASHRDGTVATESSGLGRLLLGMTDPDWHAASGDTAPLPRDTWLPSVELLVARERAATSAGLAVAVKGGSNGEHHNHNDVGSFIVASDGVPVLVDAGRPTYTLQTFGPRRYDIWTMQSAWHNVPELCGQQQPPGAGFCAREAMAVVSDETTSASFELANAYPPSGIPTWLRSVTLHRGDPARVVIDDVWDAEPAPDAKPTVVRLVVAGQVELLPDGAYVQPIEGASPVRIGWAPGIRPSVQMRELDDPMLSEVWGERLTRIELDVTDRTSVRVTVEQTDGPGR